MTISGGYAANCRDMILEITRIIAGHPTQSNSIVFMPHDQREIHTHGLKGGLGYGAA